MLQMQRIYEGALALLNKSEEGTEFGIAKRAPALLAPYIETLNLFRGAEEQLAPPSALTDALDLTTREAEALKYCFACDIASEILDIPDRKLAQLQNMRRLTMGAITTGREEIVESLLQT